MHFCKIENESQPDVFPMWRLYGNDGYGAAIIFEVGNNEADWANFLLAKVQFGQGEMVDKFKHSQNSIMFFNQIMETLFKTIRSYPKKYWP